MSTVWSILVTVGKAIAAFFGWVEGKKHEQLGELREKNRQHEANSDILDAIQLSDPDSVSDDEILRK